MTQGEEGWNDGVQDLSSPEGMSGPAWGVVKSGFLGRVLRRDLSDEVTCEHRPKRNKEIEICGNLWEKPSSQREQQMQAMEG